MESPTELIELADELCSQIAEYGKPAVQTIAAALLAERLSATERAAKIAEVYAGDSGLHPATGWSSEEADWWSTGVADGSLAIAAAIRSQP